MEKTLDSLASDVTNTLVIQTKGFVMARTNSPLLRGYGFLTLALAGAAVLATGRPDAETLATVIGWGVPDLVARVAMYAVPMTALVAALGLGREIARGRSPSVRWAIYGVAGAVAGFVMGLCLDLFAGVPDAVALVVGPLGEAGLIEMMLWIFATLCLVMGLMMAVMAVVGRPAMQALQIEDVDPECLDVRRSERAVFGWSAFGMATLGLACAALSFARLAPEGAQLTIVSAALVLGVLSAIASVLLWRGFDEMQRRQVINGYAVSAIVVTLGAFAWAGLEVLGAAPALNAAGVFLALTVLQFGAVSYTTSKIMGSGSVFGHPA